MKLRSFWWRKSLLPAVVMAFAVTALPGMAQQQDLYAIGEQLPAMPTR